MQQNTSALIPINVFKNGNGRDGYTYFFPEDVLKNWTNRGYVVGESSPAVPVLNIRDAGPALKRWMTVDLASHRVFFTNLTVAVDTSVPPTVTFSGVPKFRYPEDKELYDAGHVEFCMRSLVKPGDGDKELIVDQIITFDLCPK